MPVSLDKIINEIEKICPKNLAEDWDNVGLTIGDINKPVSKILVALDVTDDVINEAIKMQADLIITHHPIILFQKIKNITTQTPIGSKIYSLIKNGISAYAAHTNLDIVQGGTNDVLAELIGLTNIDILEETSYEKLKKIVVYVPKNYEEKVRLALCESGCGHMGNYSSCTFSADGIGTFLPLLESNPFIGERDTLEHVNEVRLETIISESLLDNALVKMKEVHPYEEVAVDVYTVKQKGKVYGIGRIGNLKAPMKFGEYANFVRDCLGLDAIRLVGNVDTCINTVGLCTGSGVEFMEVARKRGADVYITGDIKFHEAQRAIEMGLCVIDATHYASEVIIVPIIKEYIEKMAKNNGWEIEVIASKLDGQTFWHINKD